MLPGFKDFFFTSDRGLTKMLSVTADSPPSSADVAKFPFKFGSSTLAGRKVVAPFILLYLCIYYSLAFELQQQGNHHK